MTKANGNHDPANGEKLKIWPLIKYLILSLSVEPALFLMQGGFGIFSVIVTPALTWKICEQLYSEDNPGIDCRWNNNLSKTQEDTVQQTTATWIIFAPIAQFLPLFVIGPIYGAVGDRYGRKYNLMVSLFGLALLAALHILMYRFIQVPMWIFPVGSLVIAFTGFIGNVITSAYAYVCDETPDPDLLTYRLTLLGIVSTLSSSIFSLVAAEVAKTWDYYQMLMIPLGLWLLAFVYCWIFLHQVPPSKMAAFRNRRKQRQNQNGNVINVVPINEPEKPEPQTPHFGVGDAWRLLIELARNTLQAISKKREGSLRSYIWVTVFAFLILSSCGSGLMVVLSLFAARSPISWTASDLGYYGSAGAIIGLVGTGLGTFIMKYLLKMNESSMVVVTLVSTFAQVVVIAFSVHGWMLYCSAALGLLGGLVFPVCKSLAVQFIEPDEVGKIYSLFQIATDLSIMLGYGGFSALYAATVSIYAGTTFLCIAALIVLAFLGMLYVHIGFKRYRKTRDKVEKLNISS